MILVVNDHHTYEKLIEVLSEKNVMVNEPLKNHTYTHLGGKADFFVTPETYEQVQQIVKLANKEKVPFTLLGNGSNLIVKDGGIRGIILNLTNLDKIETNGTVMVAGSGARIIDASREARSEEHTSELQSRGHLVCRLLLEKKKKRRKQGL